LREKIFDNIWIQPAAGDAGGALGAALSVWYLRNQGKRKISSASDAMKGSYLGPAFSDSEIEEDLKSCGAIFKKCSER
jgi:carbamoyltransferase